MNKLEILAPAGNPDALKTAINHGANAVYLGLQDFNARISADNFTTENIKEYVRYAHSFGVRVYLTVNTLVNNDEMPQLVDTVGAAVEAKVDAYLVQDSGVRSVLQKCFPGINLHSSTQMGVHNLYGAQMAEKLGFTRVVLSREAKLEDIKQIRANTNLEIEYFVQGALCIAFSGNCYFSGMMQDDSGNRGRCKQYCRMKYTPSLQSEEFNEKYMLSAKDLCLLNNLKTLIDAGVTSFKIEGRLRRSGYVAQAVSSYRHALNNIMHQKFLDAETEVFNLRKVFSRGEFIQKAYLDDGVPNNIVNANVQNHLGIEIGKIIDVAPFKDLSKVTIQTKHKLHTGDGLKFLDNGIQICSLGVGNVEQKSKDVYIIYTKHKLRKGYTVNLILDSVMEEELLQQQKQMPISVTINASVGKPMTAVLSTQETSISHASSFVLESAKNAPTTVQEITAQFAKLGDTNFVLEDCKVIAENVFVPKSLLNEFRRQAVQKLNDQIILQNEKAIVAKIDNKAVQNIKKGLGLQKISAQKLGNIIVVNEDNLQAIIKNKSQLKNHIIALSPQEFNNATVSQMADKLKGCTLALNLPIIANYKDLKIIDEILVNNKNFFVIANNIYGLYYAQTHKVIAGFGMNVFNDYAVQFLLNFGCVGCVLSFEQQLDKINQDNVYVYSLGYAPLMTFAHCPYKTIFNNTCAKCKFTKGLSYTDVHNNSFAIRRTRLSQCYFELLHYALINNIGCHTAKHFADLRLLTDEQIGVVLNNLNSNTKCKVAKNETVGKIFNSVK